ncbi:hypothetical protein KY331_05765 [Candidatus Woesearchaeota archaeon]|nr:hypothetical protein [Candidatus Woesearchaeota archaeon]
MLVTRDGTKLKEISLDDVTGSTKSTEETRILKRCPFYTTYPDGREEKCANCNKVGSYMIGDVEYVCNVYEKLIELEAVLQ